MSKFINIPVKNGVGKIAKKILQKSFLPRPTDGTLPMEGGCIMTHKDGSLYYGTYIGVGGGIGGSNSSLSSSYDSNSGEFIVAGATYDQANSELIIPSALFDEETGNLTV